MNAIAYYLSLPFIYFLSLLPFTIMYWVSDILFVILYYLIGYRRKVVLQNLQNSFPEKSAQEIHQISKKFYRYFCDLILETLKTLTIQPADLRKHVLFKDYSLFEKYFKENQSVIVVMGHFGNWELAGARFSLEPIHTLYVIYHPLSNPYFEKLIYHMRTRLGNKLYPMKDTFRGMVRDKGKNTATAFIADQTPNPKSAYWTTFLNQETPIFTGTEKIASKLKYPIIYITVNRLKRGLYEISPELLSPNPELTTFGQISDLHTRKLEADIIKQPEIWLWSHRRWKHKKNG